MSFFDVVEPQNLGGEASDVVRPRALPDFFPRTARAPFKGLWRWRYCR